MGIMTHDIIFHTIPPVSVLLYLYIRSCSYIDTCIPRAPNLETLGLICGNTLAGEDERQSIGKANELREALSATRSGKDAQHHLGKAQHCLAAGRGDAIVAGKGKLTAASKASTVDSSNFGFTLGQQIEHLVCIARNLLHFLGILERNGEEKRWAQIMSAKCAMKGSLVLNKRVQ